ERGLVRPVVSSAVSVPVAALGGIREVEAPATEDGEGRSGLQEDQRSERPAASDRLDEAARAGKAGETPRSIGCELLSVMEIGEASFQLAILNIYGVVVFGGRIVNGSAPRIHRVEADVMRHTVLGLRRESVVGGIR